MKTAKQAAAIPDPSLRFRDVFREEMKEVQASRLKRRDLRSLRNDQIEDLRKSGEQVEGVRPLEQDLIGLAFSGGGIRSATFNLGVIQALAEKRLLRMMDYLSTVSGGGYIGSWLSSWAYQLRHQAERPERIAGRLEQLDLTASNLKAQIAGIVSDLGMFREQQPALGDSLRACETALDGLDLKSATLKDELAQIAAALRALKSRHPGSSNQIAAIEFELNQQPAKIGALPEAREVNFLRKYSNYLTPRLGVLSGDSMAFAGIYVRNVVLNQIIVISALLAVLLVPHAIALSVMCFSTVEAIPFLVVAALLLLAWFSWRIAKNMNPDTDDTARKVIGQVAVPQFLFCFAMTWLVWLIVNRDNWAHDKLLARDWPVLIGVAAGVAVVYTGLWTIATLWSKSHSVISSPLVEKRSRWAPVKWAFFAGLVAGASILIAARLFQPWSAQALVTFSVPLATLAVLLIGTIHLGLIGRDYPDSLREWWGRMGGAVLTIVILYFALFLVTLYVPGWLKYFWGWLFHSDWAGWKRLWKTLSGVGATGAITAWIGVTLRGLFVAKGANSKGPADASGGIDDALVRIAPPVFAAGLIVLLAVIVAKLMGVMTVGSTGYTTGLWQSVTCAAALLVLSLLMGGRVDVNEFSMHPAYRNRIVRCYMGATNPNRNPQMFTGFDERDNIFLHCLKDLGAPLHIINATLNIVKGKELALQTRKASSFIFSPLYSGFDYVDDQKPDSASGRVSAAAISTAMSLDSPTTTASYYRKTEEYGKNSLYPGARLGTAMAISGAAVSPNMGHYTSGAVAFLLTIFGARLGWWLGNPRDKKWWESGRPRSSWSALFRELTSGADDLKPEVYLSDGGHFDNLGVYELVRRRCRLIISIDAGADQEYGCGDLSGLVEKCRVDFRTEIKIDLEGVARNAKKPCWVGQIIYPGNDPDHPAGTLIYIKPALIPGLAQDLIAYGRDHGDFPHTSTADQFFDECEFESYRSLGHACAAAAIGEIQTALVG